MYIHLTTPVSIVLKNVYSMFIFLKKDDTRHFQFIEVLGSLDVVSQLDVKM